MIDPPIGVVLADDQALVRDMLAVRLGRESDLRVLGAVADAAAAVAAVRQEGVQVVVLDIDMPGLSPFDATRQIHQGSPGVRVLFLSGFVSDRHVERVLEVEAAGFVSKTEPPEAVVSAVRAVARGGVYFSPEVRARLVVDRDGVRLGRPGGARLSLLTPRELEMLGYLGRGYSRKKMATLAGISVKTVEQHCSHLSDKLGLHDRVDLARFAIREGLVRP